MKMPMGVHLRRGRSPRFVLQKAVRAGGPNVKDSLRSAPPRSLSAFRSPLAGHSGGNPVERNFSHAPPLAGVAFVRPPHRTHSTPAALTRPNENRLLLWPL